MRSINIVQLISYFFVLQIIPFNAFSQAINITSGSSIVTTGNANIEVGSGDFVNNGTFTSSAGSNITFNGTASQKISGTSVSTFYNLIINNASGITLQQSINIGNVLTLTAGPLDLNSNTLNISNNSSSSITRMAGYVVSEKADNSSKLKWNIGSNISSYTFPFGTIAGSYIPFILNHTSGDIGNVTVSTYPTAVNNTPYPTSPDLVTNVNDNLGNDNSANTVDRFWQINKDGPAGIATITFTATAGEVSSIINLNAQRWNSVTGGWEAPLAGQTSTANSVTVPNVSTFSPWTLTGNGSLLPITMLSFYVSEKNGVAQLYWVTASETNNFGFDVEKSTDLKEWNKIGFLTGAGNSNQLEKYFFEDLLSENFKKKDAVVYYRLKQIDINSAFKYSEIRSVNLYSTIQDLTVNFTIFPNPASQNLQIMCDQPSLQFEVNIYSQNGLLVRKYMMPGSLKIDISDLSPAVYQIVIIDKLNTRQYQYKLVKIPG